MKEPYGTRGFPNKTMMVSVRRVAGIYAIVHVESNRHYIGQAQDIYARWHVHKAFLVMNRHHCQYLQNVWNKYGDKSFRWVVLERCRIDQLDPKEQFWMDVTPKEIRLNAQPIAGTTRGFKRSEESKEKMRVAALRVGADLEERVRRSERCKRQWREGCIGRKQGRVRPRVCVKCKQQFVPHRLPTGPPSGTRWCISCRPEHKGGNYHFIR